MRNNTTENADSTAVGTTDPESGAEVIKTGYRYRTRTETTVYDFYRWSDWSDWSFEEATADNNCQVETRTVYRTNSLAGDHVWNSGTITKDTTCTAAGVKTYTCTLCGMTKTESIPAAGHTWGAVTYQWSDDFSSCTAKRVCTVDGTHIETAMATVSNAVTDKATCAKTGLKTYTATFTESWASTQTKTKAIDKLSHTPGAAVRENEVAATSESDGSYDEVVYCSVCTEELSREKVIVPYVDTNVIASGTFGTNHSWSLDKDGLLTISGTGDMGGVFSANSPAPWYEYRASVKEVKILDGVTDVGNYAFNGCSSITSVTIPTSVKRIRTAAFFGTGLTSLTIPSSVTFIGENAFGYCKSLTDLTIPGSVTSIGEGAFANCNGLKSLTISEGVVRLNSSAFSGCSGLTSVIIPNSVTAIYSSCFKDCTGLTSITIPKKVTNIYSSTFYGCTGLKSVTIPDGVKSIQSYAFYGCTSLTELSIPASVTTVEKYAFYGCTSLTEILIPSSITSIGEDAFSDCTALTDVYYGGSQEQWASLNVQDGTLLAANIHYAGESTHTHTHTYGTPTYVWDDNHSVCTATHMCTGSDCTASETATATVTSSITKAATCTVAGEKTYTATFTESWADAQTYKESIAATGHTWGEWTDQGNGTEKRTCTSCTTTESREAEAPAPVTITVGSATAVKGTSVTIPVTIDLDASISMLQFAIKYDSSVLTLTEVTAGDIFGSNTPLMSTEEAGYVYFIWEATTDLSEGGTILTLNFTVNTDESCNTTIRILTNDENNELVCCDSSFKNVRCSVADGTLKILAVIYGDINGDSKVNVIDANMARRAAVKMLTLSETQQIAADVNGDGKVNVIDANMIRRYAVKMITDFPVEQ